MLWTMSQFQWMTQRYDTAYYFILAEFKVNTYSQYTATIVTTTTIHVYQLKKLSKVVTYSAIVKVCCESQQWKSIVKICCISSSFQSTYEENFQLCARTVKMLNCSKPSTAEVECWLCKFLKLLAILAMLLLTFLIITVTYWAF